MLHWHHMIVAVDTGGTKTLIAAFAADGSMSQVAKFPTPQRIDEYLVLIEKHISDHVSHSDLDALVVALPGAVESGIATGFGNLPWKQFSIADDLRPLFPTTPLFVENDANLGGLGEVRGRADAPNRCLYLTVSTGIGGGFITNGSINQTLATSELGHMELELDDRIDRWENVASGRALTTTYGELASDITDKRHWRAIARRIGIGFLAFLPVLRPELVIIGGGVGAHFNQFAAYLDDVIADHVPERYRCPIVKAAHPEEAVVYGCYYYAIDQLAAR